MRKQLAQVRPAGTSGTVLFTPAVSGQFVVDFINIANVSGSSLAVSLFHDRDGTTFDETTALVFEQSLAAGAVLHFEAPVTDYLAASNLGCKVSVADGATFTAYGEIVGEDL